MRFDSMVDAIGHTPLVRLRTSGDVQLFAKLELQNPYGMKDRVAREVVLAARESGELAPGAPIVESSSGTLALGLALVGTVLGHPVHIVTDPRIDPITLAKLRSLGCVVHVVPAMARHGWQSARLERLADLRRELPGAYWPQQYGNPLNPRAYQALAREIVADLGPVDVLVGSVGSGGSLCGAARALRAYRPQLRVVAVDCVGSVLFGQPDLPRRRQSGLGNSLHPENLDHTVIDEVHWLNDREAFAATRDLAREQGIFAGNSAGSVYQVMKGLTGLLAPGTRVVGILPDRGDRYAENLYDDGYWVEQKLDDLPLAREPVQVPYGSRVTSWSYAPVPPRELVFVESNTTGTGMLALHQAVRLGLRPVLLTHRPGRYRGLPETPAEVVECDTNDVDALRALLSRRRSLAGVTTTSEFYLETAATLAGGLGLPGSSADAVAVCRDKARTRDLLSRAGLPQPRYSVVRAPHEVAAAVARAGLPCVVKPTSDSASTGVRLCRTEAEAQAQVATLLAVTVNVRGQATYAAVLVEQYLAGAEVSVETFAADGRVEIVGITDKTIGPEPYFVETGHIFPAPHRPESEAIRQTARSALAAVGLAHGAAHVEMRLTEAGPVVVEINARLAGGMIPELIRLATGLNLVERQLRAASGLPLEPLAPATRYAGIRFLTTATTGVLHAVDGAEEAAALPGVHDVTVTARVGAAVGPATDAYGRLGWVIADGDSPEQVRARLDQALGRMALDVTPASDGTAAADEKVTVPA
ncbi:pyridoxal-phosphate dependent enzyme [Micromonospora maris]|uniref:Pyridoxal-5'-phosphate-dependent protein n=1 Tax=Micromonospora maris TaxID=1003110 RepID=A0A9X0LCF2_9ACTN|nr:pyridoxal-phosphate dependent enzyme [Micromonospora maris]AEB45536.1 cysteine synthase [Micromonospora maris AB-18-032]KUJ44903.1 pyridoxal-5'-phosphate-dependent protein [Micromonospora maris]